MKTRTGLIQPALVTLLLAISGPSSAGSSGFISEIGKIFGSDPADYLEIEVKYKEGQCSSEFPLLVEVKNESNKDITNVRVLAYIHDANYSQAECVEYYDLKDRVIRSGESYASCWKTLKERGVHIAGERIYGKTLDEVLTMSTFEVIEKYGQAIADNRWRLFQMESDLRPFTADLSPKQGLGCNRIKIELPWHGKVASFDVFDGL